MTPSSEAQAIDPRALLGSFQRPHFFPSYRPLESGDWTLDVVPLPAARGYWGDVYSLQGAIILRGPSAAGRRSWMSMLPSEIESQEIGLGAARGHTVVLGLGMGWLAANTALRPDVERVSVVERDPDVLSLVRRLGVFEQLPEHARRKLHLVCGDALAWTPDTPVDSLQADIWLTLAEDGKLAAVQTMQRNVGARSVYFWGQEMEIWRQACRRADAVPANLDWATVRLIVGEDIQLPLVLPSWTDYPDKIVAAAQWWSPGRDGWWRVP